MRLFLEHENFFQWVRQENKFEYVVYMVHHDLQVDRNKTLELWNSYVRDFCLDNCCQEELFHIIHKPGLEVFYEAIKICLQGTKKVSISSEDFIFNVIKDETYPNIEYFNFTLKWEVPFNLYRLFPNAQYLKYYPKHDIPIEKEYCESLHVSCSSKELNILRMKGYFETVIFECFDSVGFFNFKFDINYECKIGTVICSEIITLLRLMYMKKQGLVSIDNFILRDARLNFYNKKFIESELAYLKALSLESYVVDNTALSTILHEPGNKSFRHGKLERLIQVALSLEPNLIFYGQDWMSIYWSDKLPEGSRIISTRDNIQIHHKIYSLSSSYVWYLNTHRYQEFIENKIYWLKPLFTELFGDLEI